MSEAFYHRGLTIELDASAPRLSVEGRVVQLKKVDGLYVSSELPSVKTETLFQLAQQIIEHSPDFKMREPIKQYHLAILAEGVNYWNKWRRQNPEIRPILYGTDLSSKTFAVDLSAVDFSNANLITADLSGAQLVGANFHEANLGQANLSHANLTRANFCRTDLYKTNLSYAVLNHANLIVTNTAVPVQPLLLKGSGEEPVTIGDLRRNHRSLLETFFYKDMRQLLDSLQAEVIARAEALATQLRSY